MIGRGTRHLRDVLLDKQETAEAGAGGAPGPTGPAGPRGPEGPQGPQGPVGPGAATGITQMRSTTGQSTGATANVWVAVLFAAEDYDDDGAHDLSTDTSRFTARRAGDYRVSGHVVWVGGQSTASPQRRLRLLRDGTTVIPGTASNVAYAAGGVVHPLPTRIVALTTGQYLEMQMLSALANASIVGDTNTAGADVGYGALLVVEFLR